MNILPERFESLIEQGLGFVNDIEKQNNLRVVARTIATITWQQWQSSRPPEDNRPEHEWIVFINCMKIGESEGLSLSERRIAAAFSFLHDTFFIPRITETMIRNIENEIDQSKTSRPDRAAELQKQVTSLKAEKSEQRYLHMAGGAKNAASILSQLKHPDHSAELLLSGPEIDRCVYLIARHDSWKLNEAYPLNSDRLAVVCFEADALWPLHPLGVLADLERKDQNANIQDTTDPSEWQKQIKENIKTLLEYRINWVNIENETFIDHESIFRTKEGHRLYRQWRTFWNC